ncbi:MAG TPA: class I SAM-dependent methyltransferase [Acidimicrobiia bacterium]|nr:class I SAM-dependent methyltransferase [Acidimicrobiia bacterium]
MSSYVIRGGVEGKARLGVISEALEVSTAALLDRAGLRRGMRCLDLGCGGGDVTLAMARVVGPTGAVVGIDMDAVKVELAQQDANTEGIRNVEFRRGEATELDARDAYDLVYARLLLTHVPARTMVLDRMIDAVKPGGAVVVEDLDHSAAFAYPSCPALDRWIPLYNAVSARRGGDPEIGPKLVGMLRRAGLADVELAAVQPAFVSGPAKRIHQITVENVRDAILREEMATDEELEELAAELEAFSADRETIVGFVRIYQVWGRRPR